MSDFFAGLCAGVTQTAVGHPFDTMKVLLQNKQQFKHLRVSELYRGWRYPMCMSVLFNATVFPMYERTYVYTQNHFLSGFLSGVVVSPIAYSFDVGKIKEQTRQKIKLADFYKTKGLFSTTIRESIAMSLYFGTYNYCKETHDLDPLIAGGFAGLSNWSLTYPIDVIRNRQIAQNISIKQAYNQGNLWRGYSLCIARAVIVNAAQFKVYEIVKQYINNKVDN